MHLNTDEGSGKDWLRGSLNSDPLVLILEREEASERRNISKRFGYSQAAVYAFLVIRFGRTDAAAYLVVSKQTLEHRMGELIEHVEVQPSLFDRTEYIDPDFLPKPGIPRLARKRSDLAVRQLSIRLNRMSEVRYLMSLAYKRLVAFMASIRVQPAMV